MLAAASNGLAAPTRHLEMALGPSTVGPLLGVLVAAAALVVVIAVDPRRRCCRCGARMRALRPAAEGFCDACGRATCPA